MTEHEACSRALAIPPASPARTLALARRIASEGPLPIAGLDTAEALASYNVEFLREARKVHLTTAGEVLLAREGRRAL